MFSLPDSAPWWAVLAVAVLGIIMLGVRGVVRAVWPQSSAHRKELLREWQRQREVERERQRREIDNRE
ncbi:hypothetical protein GA0115261_1000825 [Streptomyces sp. OspMP-M43]|nr:hypothetical protein GA0115261_1000825 [Streptomyces sp. OspMP-M43]